MKRFFKYSILAAIVFVSICGKKANNKTYKTKHVVIIVMDGARYSETWGDSVHRYIPHIATQMSKVGIINDQFYNNGYTETTAGHTAMSRGVYQNINNTGQELPQNPSFMQYWRKLYGFDSTSCWVITSKDKLAVLANCKDSVWYKNYMPATDCGVNGNGTGYREDSVTYRHTIEKLSKYHPSLVLVNFKDPDSWGHQNNWANYLKGISGCDEYAYRIWEYLQSDPFYKGTTTLFITNDHGRHLNGVADGFVSHGCTCNGCRHIFLYAFGPDFKQNMIDKQSRELIDIPATIAELLHIDMPKSKGHVMGELLK